MAPRAKSVAFVVRGHECRVDFKSRLVNLPRGLRAQCPAFRLSADEMQDASKRDDRVAAQMDKCNVVVAGQGARAAPTFNSDVSSELAASFVGTTHNQQRFWYQRSEQDARWDSPCTSYMQFKPGQRAFAAGFVPLFLPYLPHAPPAPASTCPCPRPSPPLSASASAAAAAPAVLY